MAKRVLKRCGVRGLTPLGLASGLCASLLGCNLDFERYKFGDGGTGTTGALQPPMDTSATKDDVGVTVSEAGDGASTEPGADDPIEAGTQDANIPSLSDGLSSSAAFDSGADEQTEEDDASTASSSSIADAGASSSGSSTGTSTPIEGCDLGRFDLGDLPVTIRTQEDLEYLRGSTEVVGELEIVGNAITDLSPLQCMQSKSAPLRIRATTVKSLAGLEALRELTGSLTIEQNDALLEVNALSALTAFGGGLEIKENSVLSNLDGLNGLTSVGSLEIVGNEVLTRLGLANLVTVDPQSLNVISSNPVLPQCEVDALRNRLNPNSTTNTISFESKGNDETAICETIF